MKSRSILALSALLGLALLAGCTRGGSDQGAGTAPPMATFTIVPLDPGNDALPPDDGSLPPTDPTATLPSLEAPPTESGEAAPTEGGEAAPPAEPASRLSGLRFAGTGTGIESTTFPARTEEVCAIFDYRDMQAADILRRVWLLNGTVYVERQEPWPIDRYGASGVVRDICLFDRIDGNVDGSVDGFDPGQWRVELYLNGGLETSAEFTVEP